MQTGGSGHGSQGVGAQLNAARQRQGWSLAEVAKRLRLTEDQVAALEEEDFGYLHGDTFVRGYLRNYARSLEMDPEAVIDAYEQSGPEPAGTEETPLVPPSERPIMEHPWRVALVSLVLVGLVSAGVLALVTTDLLGPDGKGEAPGQQASSASGEGDGDVGPEATDSQTAGAGDAQGGDQDATGRESSFSDEPPEPITPSGSASGTDGGLSPTREAAPDPDEMRVRTWEKAWLEVTDARGRVLLRRLVGKGKELHLYGQAPFGVKVGNAAGVQLYYKDDPLPPLGGIGQVVTRTVGPQSETIAESEVGPPEVLLEARRKGLPTTGEGPPPEAQSAPEEVAEGEPDAGEGGDGEAPATPAGAAGQGG